MEDSCKVEYWGLVDLHHGTAPILKWKSYLFNKNISHFVSLISGYLDLDSKGLDSMNILLNRVDIRTGATSASAPTEIRKRVHRTRLQNLRTSFRGRNF